MAYSSPATKKNFERIALGAAITEQLVREARLSCEDLRDYARSIERDSLKAMQSKFHPSITAREYGDLVQIAQHLTDIAVAVKNIEANF